MILNKKFDCNTEKLDDVVVALAKEIEDGWHIYKIEQYPFKMCYEIKRNEPTFSIELCKRDKIMR